jgi:FlaA1/EpsC-like NDP-sugar epimerase
MIDFFRKNKKLLFLFIDLLIIIFSAWLSFIIRFDGRIPVEQVGNFYNLLFLSVLIGLPIFYWQKLYHFTWRYIGLSDLYQIIKAVTFSNVLVAAILFILRDFPIFSGFPRSIILINYFIGLLSLGFLRMAKRLFFEQVKPSVKDGKKLLIIGAGNSAEELIRSVIHLHAYNLVGLIDDASSKQNTRLHGFPVLGVRADIPKIVKNFEIQQIIIAMPKADQSVIRETVESCRTAHVKEVKILPSFEAILTGKISVASLRDISIEDLLGRVKVEIDTQAIAEMIKDKIILITGAAGSIGSNLCLQVLKFSPRALITIDQNETAMFHLERDLNKLFFKIKKYFFVADVIDQKKMDRLFSRFKPDIVFHAAAYKHVPVMETQPEEAIKNNVLGTLCIGQAAIKSGAEKFVLISTDKAINPTSVMGVSKRICEMVCLWLNKQNKTKFSAVRFGNVLDSQGNVVVLYKEAISRGEPLEVTHPDVKRYFMVTSEACLLVMQAGALSQGGEVFVLDMGEPIKILDLAKEMIRLAGYQPDIDIPIVFTELRPGEKLFEEILVKDEHPTKYDKIFISRLEKIDEDKLKSAVEIFQTSLAKLERSDIIRLLKDLVPNYQNNE